MLRLMIYDTNDTIVLVSPPFNKLVRLHDVSLTSIMPIPTLSKSNLYKCYGSGSVTFAEKKRETQFVAHADVGGISNN